MHAVLKLELRKAFTNRLFLTALAVASAVAIYSAVFCILSYFKFKQMDAKANSLSGVILNPELPGSSLFTHWLGQEFISPAGALFYLLMPLLAALGYGWSYQSERKSGYMKHIVTRASKQQYFLSKYIAVFLCGGTVAVVPLMLNIMLVSAFVPAIQPDVFYDTYYSMHPWSAFADLFYAQPYAFMFLKICGTFVFSGLIAEISLCVTFLSRNIFVVTLTPLFFMLILNYISNSLSGMPEISPVQFLHSGLSYVSLPIVCIEGAVLFAVTFSVVGMGRKNDVF